MDYKKLMHYIIYFGQQKINSIFQNEQSDYCQLYN